MTADPVFVDRSGRRRRLILIAGTAGTLVLLAAIVALLAGFTGAGPAVVPGWPGADAGRPAPNARVAGTRSSPPPPVATASARPSPQATVAAPPSSSAPAPAPSAGTSTRPKGRAHSPSAHPSRKK